MKYQIGRGKVAKAIYKNSVVITTASLAPLYGEDHLIIPNDKSEETYNKIHQELFKRDVSRDTTIIAFGGGTILDVVAFAASTYMRGVPLVLIPTSLLAMVDASIGGKTAIDTPLGKNLIGSFYLPKEVVIDFDLLKTLSKVERENGFFEVLKMGLIYEHSVFQHEHSDEVYLEAIKAKREIVKKDPKERGLRRILNFGHTVGHGLEKVGEGMSHGRAVALGCLAESFLSMSLGFLKKEEFEKIEALYRPFFLTLPKGYSRSQLIEKMKFDKKKKGGALRFCLIDRIGHALEFSGEYCIPVKEFHQCLDYLEKNYE